MKKFMFICSSIGVTLLEKKQTQFPFMLNHRIVYGSSTMFSLLTAPTPKVNFACQKIQFERQYKRKAQKPRIVMRRAKACTGREFERMGNHEIEEKTSKLMIKDTDNGQRKTFNLTIN